MLDASLREFKELVEFLEKIFDTTTRINIGDDGKIILYKDSCKK